MRGVGLGIIDRQDLGEARGIQDAPGLGGRRCQGQTAGCGPNRPPDPDEDPDTGGVDEPDPGEVDHQAAEALIGDDPQAVAQHTAAGHVNLTGYLHHGNAVRQSSPRPSVF